MKPHALVIMVAVMVMLALPLARGESCAAGEVYDGGIPYSHNVVATKNIVCPGVTLGSSNEAIQLFTPPELPYVYDTLCFGLGTYVNGPLTPSNLTATVILVPLTRGSFNFTPTPTESQSFNTSWLVRRLDDPLRNFSSTPAHFVVFDQRVYIGIRYASCNNIFRLGRELQLAFNRQAWYRDPLDADKTWWAAQQYYGHTTFAIRATGHKYTATAAELVAAGWTCPFANYSDGVRCDCGCGLTDPDCLLSAANTTGGPMNSPDCLAGQVCAQGHCVTTGWTSSKCNSAYYGTDGVCDCACGASMDPDCNDLFAVVRGCDGMVAPKCVSNQCVEKWGCDTKPASLKDGYCTCGCGVYDPDCSDVSNPSNCPSGTSCNKNAKCMSVHWLSTKYKCHPAYYSALDNCDCNCGAYDPDCSVAGQSITGCSQGQSCIFNATCMTARCGNGYPDIILTTPETCDGGKGCDSCQCKSGWKATDPVSIDCQADCNDNIWIEGEEECDGSLYCNQTTCKCQTGHSTYSPATGKCTGCGNDILDEGEECEKGSGCDTTTCLCTGNHKASTPVSLFCESTSSTAIIASTLSVAAFAAIVVILVVSTFFIVRHIRKIKQDQANAAVNQPQTMVEMSIGETAFIDTSMLTVPPPPDNPSPQSCSQYYVVTPIQAVVGSSSGSGVSVVVPISVSSSSVAGGAGMGTVAAPGGMMYWTNNNNSVSMSIMAEVPPPPDSAKTN